LLRHRVGIGDVRLNRNHASALRHNSRVVINAVGRVGDHKVRRDATEYALNVQREIVDRAVGLKDAGVPSFLIE
jgi:hypothetical protein